MRKTLAVAVLVALALSTIGCGTAVKQGFATVTGASARYYEIKKVGPETALNGYRSVRVETFDTSPMRGAIPAALPAMVKSAIEGKVAEMKHMTGGDPALVVRGKFMDYDPGGSALRAVGFGVNPFLTAQIELVDAAGGQVKGVAMVTGTVKSAIRMGEGELADGVAKAVKKLIEEHAKQPGK